MTNHSEKTGPSGNDGIGERRGGRTSPPGDGGATGRGAAAASPSGNGRFTGRHGTDRIACTAYDSRGPEHQITLRTPAELADALPYLLGYRPEDSIVLLALQDGERRGRFGGRARLGIPAQPEDWPCAARQLVHGLITAGERRGTRPERMVAYVCQEPAPGGSGRDVMERLRPLVQQVRVECGALDVPVIEALCISDGRFWSYCCVDGACCPADGTPMGLPGTSVLAAAATYAGLQVRGSLGELRARLLPRENSAALDQEAALDAAGMALIPRMLDETGNAEVAEETLALASRVMSRLAAAPPVAGTVTADARDDDLLGHDEAARLILGLQDRTTRDRAAEWMEGDEAGPALRLWRALARRCVGSYGEHAAAPLTLAGWVAWSTGDELEAREALAMALGADPDYLFARLLHQACNEGLDPESVRRCLRGERVGRGAAASSGDGQAPAQTTESAERRAAEPSPRPGAVPEPRHGSCSAGAAAGTVRRARERRDGPGTDTRRPRTPAGGKHPGGSRPGPAPARTSGTGNAPRPAGRPHRGRRRGDVSASGSGPEAAE